MVYQCSQVTEKEHYRVTLFFDLGLRCDNFEEISRYTGLKISGGGGGGNQLNACNVVNVFIKHKHPVFTGQE